MNDNFNNNFSIKKLFYGVNIEMSIIRNMIYKSAIGLKYYINVVNTVIILGCLICVCKLLR